MTKPKKCTQCKQLFTPRTMGQKVCGIECAIAFSRGRIAHDKKKANDKRRQELKTMTDHKREAQTAFNKYIRARDKGKGCISCGNRKAGQYHAGHYRTRAAAPQLAFNTFNVHLQCAQCNSSKSGNIVEYRINLVKRIGVERVERMECNNESFKRDAKYFQKLKKIFNRRARHIEKLRSTISENTFKRLEF